MLGPTGEPISIIYGWFSEDNPNLSLSLNSLNVPLYLQGIHVRNSLSSKDELNKTEGTPIDSNFRLNEGILYFSLNYNGNNINGEVHRNGCAKSGNGSVPLAILVKETNSITEVICITDTETSIFFRFLITDITNLSTIQWIELGDPLQSNAPTTCNTVNESLRKIFKQENDVNLRVELFAQTDNFGLNLGELGGIVTADQSYPNGYPKELVGECDNAQQVTNIGVQTLYSFRPKLNTVLKGTGNTLFAQTNDVNSMYNTSLSDCEFYLNIIVYSTYRYMLAGLSSNGKFSTKWLYANNYDKFLRNLRNSEFSAATVIFTEPQECFNFTNFNRYFINCAHK